MAIQDIFETVRRLAQGENRTIGADQVPQNSPSEILQGRNTDPGTMARFIADLQTRMSGGPGGVDQTLANDAGANNLMSLLEMTGPPVGGAANAVGRSASGAAKTANRLRGKPDRLRNIVDAGSKPRSKPLPANRNVSRGQRPQQPSQPEQLSPPPSTQGVPVGGPRDVPLGIVTPYRPPRPVEALPTGSNPIVNSQQVPRLAGAPVETPFSVNISGPTTSQVSQPGLGELLAKIGLGAGLAGAGASIGGDAIDYGLNGDAGGSMPRRNVGMFSIAGTGAAGGQPPQGGGVAEPPPSNPPATPNPMPPPEQAAEPQMDPQTQRLQMMLQTLERISKRPEAPDLERPPPPNALAAIGRTISDYIQGANARYQGRNGELPFDKQQKLNEWQQKNQVTREVQAPDAYQQLGMNQAAQMLNSEQARLSAALIAALQSGQLPPEVAEQVLGFKTQAPQMDEFTQKMLEGMKQRMIGDEWAQPTK